MLMGFNKCGSKWINMVSDYTTYFDHLANRKTFRTEESINEHDLCFMEDSVNTSRYRNDIGAVPYVYFISTVKLED